MEDAPPAMMTADALRVTVAPEVIRAGYIASQAGDVWFAGVLAFCVLLNIDSEQLLADIVKVCELSSYIE